MKFDIFSIKNEDEFNGLALKIYRWQVNNCNTYKAYHNILKVDCNLITSVEKIPFLPIEFFKNYEIISGKEKTQMVFTSSATTSANTSKHFVTDLELYEKSFTMGFEKFYGKVTNYCIIALLPNYYERSGSSLVYMTNKLIEKSKNKNSGFFLHNLNDLHSTILTLEKSKQKTILIGVSYALLNLLEIHNYSLKHVIIMETGGMKGKRKELLKSELHNVLCEGFGIKNIHSEYGMTEILSQAYSTGNGIYQTVPWMKVVIRDTNDPLSLIANGGTGGINIIDLANYNSCSFIATQDLGRAYKNNSFEILGRFDNSDIRGCNLLVE